MLYEQEISFTTIHQNNCDTSYFFFLMITNLVPQFKNTHSPRLHTYGILWKKLYFFQRITAEKGSSYEMKTRTNTNTWTVTCEGKTSVFLWLSYEISLIDSSIVEHEWQVFSHLGIFPYSPNLCMHSFTISVSAASFYNESTQKSTPSCFQLPREGLTEGKRRLTEGNMAVLVVCC